MIDETRQETGAAASGGAIPTGAPAGTEQIGYCQHCGRVLTAAEARRTNHGLFCPLCAAQREGGMPQGAWQPMPPTPGPAGAPGMGTSLASEPNPAAAAWLGLIPGVGAMYNGQYAKGFAHIAVFALLVSLSESVDVFGIFVAFWIFYQAIEAYHTARARRDGLPLPNPFGLNDIGERLGFGRSWPFPEAAARSTGNPGATGVSPGASTGYSGAYAPPSEPAGAAAWTAPPAYPQPFVPYAETYAGPRAPAPELFAAAPLPLDPAESKSFPVSALWLIGLGILFLLSNLQPSWHLNGRWLVPILLGALSLWIATRRFEAFRLLGKELQTGAALANTLLVPAMLFSVAVLLGLQAGNLVALRLSWPALLVILGVLLLARRATEQVTLPPSQAPLDPGRTRDASGGPLGL